MSTGIHRTVRLLPAFTLGFGVCLMAQSPIPCKYFPTQSSIDVGEEGGTVVVNVRADPAQIRLATHAEYAKRCALAANTLAPWAHITDIGALNAEGYAEVTVEVEPNLLAETREAVFTVGTPSTVFPGAPPHYANSALKVLQKSAPRAVTVNGNGAVNNASYLARVSPGSLFSIFGSAMSSTTQNGFPIPLPTSFAGTSVTMNGILCPLLYVSPNLINAQVPMNVGIGTATVAVSYNGTVGSTSVPVVSASPGLFYSTTNNTVVAQHNTGVLVSAAAPAQAGEVVGVYGTGIGPISPALNSGAGAGSYPNLSQATTSYSATINGTNAPVSYLGLTPGLVGLMQLNVQIPPNAPGGNLPLLLTVNGVTSQSGVVIPVAGSAPAQVSINSFSFNPATVSAGQTTVLSWTTTGATTVTLDHGIGAVNANGQIVLGGSSPYPLPSSTDVYTLTAYSCVGVSCGANTQTSARATLNISAPPASGPAINSFTADSTSIAAGQSTTLRWSTSNATNVSITGLGSVPASGSVTVAPASSTTYTLTASNAVGSRTASVAVSVYQASNVTLVFTNQLLNDANVSVNGTVIGSVSAGQTQQKTVPSQPTMNVTFDVISSTTSAGTAVGDPISGFWDTLNSPTGTVDLTISNYFANTGTYYFAPLITNTSGTTLEMAVNYGLQHQNECNCTVASGVGPVKIGYYLYYSNSNVYGFNANANPRYSGPYRYFNGITVAAGSGQTNLTFNVFP